MFTVRWPMRNNTQHPNVKIAFGLEYFPEPKDARVLYLYGSVPGEPLNIACPMTPTRFALLQEVVSKENLRVFGYNAVRRPTFA